jgi:hypothetical protein
MFSAFTLDRVPYIIYWQHQLLSVCVPACTGVPCHYHLCCLIHTVLLQAVKHIPSCLQPSMQRPAV